MADDNNWDLQAVVRSCSGSAAATADRGPFTASFSPSPPPFDGVVNPNSSSSSSSSRRAPPIVQELEELYKPFFRPTAPARPPEQQPPPPLFLRQQQPAQLQRPSFSDSARSKKRKKQQKKVVCQVPADGVSTDLWAWRKYGQKPIKGSPYPRGYYRCSSSKGCPARKQVERSRADPGVLLITYTSDHNHPIPTHRNSLAGSTRHKVNVDSTKVNSSDQGVNAGVNGASPATAEEEEEGMLLETDGGILGDDDLLFAALDDPGQPSPTATDVVADEFDDQMLSIFSSAEWMSGNTTAAASRI